MTTSSSRSRLRMDTSKAMALLGFSSSKTFEQTEMNEIQVAFMMKVHAIETSFVGHRASKRDELRRVNEAFQFLRKKQKNFSGRSMHQNWQVVGGKSRIIHAFVHNDKHRDFNDNDNDDYEPQDKQRMREGRAATTARRSPVSSLSEKDELGLFAKEREEREEKRRRRLRPPNYLLSSSDVSSLSSLSHLIKPHSEALERTKSKKKTKKRSSSSGVRLRTTVKPPPSSSVSPPPTLVRSMNRRSSFNPPTSEIIKDNKDDLNVAIAAQSLAALHLSEQDDLELKISKAKSTESLTLVT